MRKNIVLLTVILLGMKLLIVSCQVDKTTHNITFLAISHLLADFETYLKTAFQWSVFSTSLSFFFLRFSSYLACMHPMLYHRIVNNRNSVISIIISGTVRKTYDFLWAFFSDLLPLPVLFVLQFYVYHQGLQATLIIEIIFAALVFIFEIVATFISLIAYVRIHYKYVCVFL